MFHISALNYSLKTTGFKKYDICYWHTMMKKYQGFATPYLPGMTESIYHVTMLYRTVSTMSITHIRPMLMSPSLPLGGVKKFPQVRPSPKVSRNTIFETNTKVLCGANWYKWKQLLMYSMLYKYYKCSFP